MTKTSSKDISPTQFVEAEWSELKLETKNYSNVSFQRIDSTAEPTKWEVIRTDAGVRLGMVRYNSVSKRYDFWPIADMLYSSKVMANITHFMHRVKKVREIVDGQEAI